MPPHTTAMSATLNTGHHCRSMKSTTAPDMNLPPGWTRLARSTTLPTAPPMTVPQRTSASGDRSLRAENATTTAMPIATIPMTGPMPAPLENAMPLFSA